MAESLGTDPGDGISGSGTTLSGSATGPIGMLEKVTFAGLDVANDIDITTMNSNNWKKFIAGLMDAKEISFDMIYDNQNARLVIGALTGANQTWTVALPDGSTFVCNGYIKHLGLEVPNGDKIMQPMTIKLSGKPAFQSSSSGTPVVP